MVATMTYKPWLTAFLGAGLVAGLTTGRPGPAHAEGGYAEAVVGLALPLADDDYEDLDESVKVGLRAGSGSSPTAIELTADYTPFGETSESGLGTIEIDFDRFRVLAGIRHRIPMGGKGGQIFIRAALGGDLVRFGAQGTLVGFDIDRHDTDPGLAAELGGGFVIPVSGKLYVGGQLAVPMAFHFDDDDPDDPDDADLEYTGIDLDLLFTIGTTM
jgi:hypothetical protein